MLNLIWAIYVLVLVVVAAAAFVGYRVGSSQHKIPETPFGRRPLLVEDPVWMVTYIQFANYIGVAPFVGNWFGPFDDGTVTVVNKGDGTLGSAGKFVIKMSMGGDFPKASYLTHFTLEPDRRVRQYRIRESGGFQLIDELHDTTETHLEFALT